MTQRFEAEFIPSVRDWCRQNADKVSKCYASLYQGYPSVFVVGPTRRRRNGTLGGPLAELGTDLVRRGYHCNLLEIPPEQTEHYDAFLEAEHAVLVYGDGAR